MSVRVCLLLGLISLAAPAAAQVQVGNDYLIGYTSDFRERPVFYYAGLSGGATFVGGERRESVVAVRLGAGYRFRLSDRLYVGGQLGLGVAQQFGSNNRTSVSLYPSLVAFTSISPDNRWWVKAGLPYRDFGSDLYSGTIGLVFVGGRRPTQHPYVRGPLKRRGLSVAMRAGATYGARSVGAIGTATLNRWELGLGVHYLQRGLTAGLGDDYRARGGVPASAHLGYALRRRAHSEVQLVVEGAWRLGGVRAAAVGEQYFNAALYARYRHLLTSRLSLQLETGLSAQRAVAPGISDFTSVLHQTAGLRWRL